MLYGNSSMGYGFSPDRSRDVDRFNPSTRGNYSTAFANASGSYQTGYWYSATPTYSGKPSGSGWYDGAGRYHKD